MKPVNYAVIPSNTFKEQPHWETEPLLQLLETSVDFMLIKYEENSNNWRILQFRQCSINCVKKMFDKAESVEI